MKNSNNNQKEKKQNVHRLKTWKHVRNAITRNNNSYLIYVMKLIEVEK